MKSDCKLRRHQNFERRSAQNPASTPDLWARGKNLLRRDLLPTSSGWIARVLQLRDFQPAKKHAPPLTADVQFPRTPRELSRTFRASPSLHAASRAT